MNNLLNKYISYIFIISILLIIIYALIENESVIYNYNNVNANIKYNYYLQISCKCNFVGYVKIYLKNDTNIKDNNVFIFPTINSNYYYTHTYPLNIDRINSLRIECEGKSGLIEIKDFKIISTNNQVIKKFDYSNINNKLNINYVKINSFKNNITIQGFKDSWIMGININQFQPLIINQININNLINHIYSLSYEIIMVNMLFHIYYFIYLINSIKYYAYLYNITLLTIAISLFSNRIIMKVIMYILIDTYIYEL